MINDFGNGKLPRFEAGKPLLDQVTAERMNDILAMMESLRLQNGVGYLLNRTSAGTTLTIGNEEYVRRKDVENIIVGALPGLIAGIIPALLPSIMAEIMPIIEPLKELLDNREEVAVVGADGNMKTLTVLSSADGASLQKELFYFNGNTGSFEKMEVLALGTPVSQGTTASASDFFEMEYIDASGNSQKLRVLRSPKNQTPTSKTEQTEVVVCEDGNATKKKFIVVK